MELKTKRAYIYFYFIFFFVLLEILSMQSQRNHLENYNGRIKK